MVKKKNNITIIVIVIVSIVIVGGILTWGFLTNWWQKDFKVGNCVKYNDDLTCKECDNLYYLEDNKCKKYDVVESREILNELIKNPLPSESIYSINENDEYIKKDGTKNYGPIRTWKLGKDVKDLSNLFLNNATFNENISEWDVSNVTNMKSMFDNAYKFNQPLNNWDVSNVTNMNGMFNNAYTFNQPLDNWDVSNVTDMTMMFARELMGDGTNKDPIAFKQDLSKWKLNCKVKTDFMFWAETKQSLSLMPENYKPKETSC